MSVWESFKSNGLKYFTPKRAMMWARSKFRRKNGIVIDPEDVIEFSEVIVYRSNLCRECKVQGKCVVCKCPFKDLISDMESECSQQRWFGLGKNWKESWIKQKYDGGISFLINRN